MVAICRYAVNNILHIVCPKYLLNAILNRLLFMIFERLLHSKTTNLRRKLGNSDYNVIYLFLVDSFSAVGK